MTVRLLGTTEGACLVCGDTPVQSRGLCNRHYLRLLRHGDPTGGARERRPFEFWVERTEHGLVWTGQTHTVRGLVYGRYGHVTAHRVAYGLWVAPIPAGDYVVDHQPSCPKVCVTPQHLTLYTRGEHTRVGWQRGEITGRRAHDGRGPGGRTAV